MTKTTRRRRLRGEFEAVYLSGLSEIANTTVTDLDSTWREVCGSEPPDVPIRLLAHGIAWKLQMQSSTVGVQVEEELARLDEMRADPSHHPDYFRRRPHGNKTIVGHWRGKEFTVTVTDFGLVYDGDLFETLDQIARQITGKRVSGRTLFSADAGPLR